MHLSHFWPTTDHIFGPRDLSIDRTKDLREQIIAQICALKESGLKKSRFWISSVCANIMFNAGLPDSLKLASIT